MKVLAAAKIIMVTMLCVSPTTPSFLATGQAQTGASGVLSLDDTMTNIESIISEGQSLSHSEDRHDFCRHGGD